MTRSTLQLLDKIKWSKKNILHALSLVSLPRHHQRPLGDLPRS